MAVIFSTKQRSAPRVAVVKAIDGLMERVGVVDDYTNTSSAFRRFNEFWELMDVINQHGYLRASMSVIGRSAIGTGWTLRRHPEYGDSAPELHRKRLFDFYTYRKRSWNNIKDFHSVAFKMMIGAMYLRYFGQCAYYIVEDENHKPLGLDFLYGLVVPNVDNEGRFKAPAFIQYPSRNPKDKVEFHDPNRIVFITTPDWQGSPLGGSDIVALTTYTLPIDLYLMTAAREYMKNRDKPEVVYSVPSDLSQEGFDTFVKMMNARHAGAVNLGRNPVVVQGDFSVHELRDLPDKLPYQEARKQAREEALAVTGVAGAKLGLSQDMSAANIREMRREFHEATLLPLFTMIEQGFYEQIHVRRFNAPGWEYRFNSPDFLNAVERATVHMRYRQMGVLTPNEIRYELGHPARTDDGGDAFIEPKGSTADDDYGNGGTQGSPPEGREPEPDDPSVIGEPTLDGDDPVRGDQHDETPRNAILKELRVWRKFVINRIERGKPVRRFDSKVIPSAVLDIVTKHLAEAVTVREAAQIFDAIKAEVEKYE